MVKIVAYILLGKNDKYLMHFEAKPMTYMTQYWRILLEAIPMIVALFVIINGVAKAVSVRNRIWRSLSWMFVMSASLLIIAQSSWSWTFFVKQDLLGTDVANVIWTVFNTMAMTSMLFALKESKK